MGLREKKIDEALRPGSPDAHDLMKRGCSNAAGPMQRSNQGRRTTHEISIVSQLRE